MMQGKTECYDCNVKEVPKSFPVCTIRSTPSQPIHCIVWAKSYLFTEIFGTSEDEAPELDQSEDADNAAEIEKLRKEAQALKKIRESMGSEDFPRLIFEKVYKEDIDRLRSMEEMWKSRKPPESLDFETLSRDALGVGSAVAQQDQKVWSLAENFAVFNDSLRRLSNRLDELKANADIGNAPPILTFDKDDKDTLGFVAASSNLRSHIFGIETRSEFDIKQMAGNIIPAIATTNAMTAGLCVLQGFKVMQENLARARMVFLATSTERIITAEQLHPPNPECPVCSVAHSKLTVDPARATLGDVVDKLKAELGYGEEFSVNSDAGILYDPDYEDNVEKRLSELSVGNDSFLTVRDEDDEPKVDLRLAVHEAQLPGNSPAVVLQEKPELPKKPKQAKPVNGTAHPVLNGVINNVAQSNGEAGGVKRKRDADDAGLEDGQVRKRGKVPEQADGDDVVILDDTGGSGAIVINDD